jgi:tRNA threonylcarbamoyladenosine biosynthesis protein TsaE
MVVEIETRSPEETQDVAEGLGRELRGGEVLGLSGDLGAGKTCFVRGLARGLAIDPDLVYSPSFTLVAEHRGRLVLNHLDLFRLGDPVTLTEAEEIGLNDYLDPRGVAAIEWAGRLPEGRFTVAIDIGIGQGDRRRIRLSAAEAPGTDILRRVAARVQDPRGMGERPCP